MSAYRILLVPYDFSEHAKAALAAAVVLAQRLDAELHLLRVVQTPFHPAPSQEGCRPTAPYGIREGVMHSLREIASSLCDAPRSVTPHVVEGANIAASIRCEAEAIGADLIIMGTHGRTNVPHRILGNVTERILENAPCPVLTVSVPGDARVTRMPRALAGGLARTRSFDGPALLAPMRRIARRVGTGAEARDERPVPPVE